MEILKKIANNLFLIVTGKRRFGQSWNLMRYNLSGKGIRLAYKPIYLTILPIYRCNLSCKMCLTHSRELPDTKYRHKPFPNMSLEMFKDIVDTFKNSVAVGFMGNGEPLLHKDIFAMILYAKRNKMRTSLITNGLLLDRIVDEIVDSGLDEIAISINGHNADEFFRVTGVNRNCFDKIIENSSLLLRAKTQKKSNLRIGASIIIDRENIFKLQEMIDYSAGIGFDSLSFYTVLPLLKSVAEKVAPYKNVEIEDYLKNLSLPGKNKMLVRLPVLLARELKLRRCNDFFTCINVDGNGNVGGCNRQRFDLETNGKYYDDDVWNNRYFQEERAKFLLKDGPMEEPCEVCYANQMNEHEDL